MSLAAYLPDDRRRALAQGRDLLDRASGAALFADISGFTPLTEVLARVLGPRLGVEELTRQLNQVYDALIVEVKRFGGSVVFFSGDAITCWFDDGSWGNAAASESPAPNSQLPSPARAVACALAFQQAIRAFEAIPLPDGETTALALKVAIAFGPARRFVVGDPAVQCRDVLPGATLDRLAAAEHFARPREVLLDSKTVESLGDAIRISEWRMDTETGERFAVLRELKIENVELKNPDVASDLSQFSILNSQFKAWLLPTVYARLAAGHDDVPIELRPTTALLLRFGRLDYDGDDAAGAHLDRYIRWVEGILERYGGTLIDLTIGDKGSYLYSAFGAPVAHENDAERALRAALELLTPPPEQP
jgi:adenylate cyclase